MDHRPAVGHRHRHTSHPHDPAGCHHHARARRRVAGASRHVASGVGSGAAPIVWTAAGTGSAVPAVTMPVPDGMALDVSTPAARRRSALRLLRASGKKTDRWIARHIHRKISRLFSYALLQAGLTPNSATFLTFLVGVASAWMLAQTSHQTLILGALVFWFASVADGIDGEMARLTLRESACERLDTAVTQATYPSHAGLLSGAGARALAGRAGPAHRRRDWRASPPTGVRV